VQLELVSNEAIRIAIESGVWSIAIEKSVAAKSLFRLDGEIAKRSFYASCHKERPVSKAKMYCFESL
jgi:hypothetical protein